MRTDTVSDTAFRGFGGPQGMMFAERMMDAIAITLGLDALVVRKRNLYAPGRDMTPYGMRVEVHVVTRIVRRLDRTSGYAARRHAITQFNARAERRTHGATLRKGIALTPVKFGIVFTLKQLNQAGALVHVFTDGSVQVNHGGTEMGQIEGGFVQGMGWLTTEELVFADDGRLLTHAPSTYKIPTCSDVPEDFRVDLYEPGRNREPTIHRSKAVGEPPLMHALSVFSAVTHALASLAPGRVPPLDAPATPEAILRAADEMQGDGS